MQRDTYGGKFTFDELGSFGLIRRGAALIPPSQGYLSSSHIQVIHPTFLRNRPEELDSHCAANDEFISLVTVICSAHVCQVNTTLCFELCAGQWR